MRNSSTSDRASGSLRPPGVSGQAVVELAMVVPVFLIIIAIAIDLGRLFNAYVAIESAAKEGAFFGATNPWCDVAKAGCTDPNTVDWHVRSEAGSIGIGGPTIRCLDARGTAKRIASCDEGDTYQVTVTHGFRLLTPILSTVLGQQLTLRSSASSVVLNEAFDPAAASVPVPAGTSAWTAGVSATYQ